MPMSAMKTRFQIAECSLLVSGHLRTVSQDKIKFLFFIKRNRA